MEPITTAALVGAGASLLGSGANQFAAGKMNKATRRWNEKMYDRQKADNLEFWNTQNSYNSPEQQMQRLTAAGLNPNLVYGNGAVANSTSAPETPHAMPYRPSMPDINLPQIADTYYNIRSRAQSLSNDKAVGDNLLMQNELMKAQLTKAKLENSFTADTMASRMRGFFGDNENKYNNAVKSFLNKDMLEYLAGQSVNFNNRGARVITSGDSQDSFLVKDWMLKYNGQKLGNQLRSGAIERNKLDNSIKATQSQYQERLMRGNIEDISAQDWIRMLLQGIGAVRR